jgi:hypothetical protein
VHGYRNGDNEEYGTDNPRIDYHQTRITDGYPKQEKREHLGLPGYRSVLSVVSYVRAKETVVNQPLIKPVRTPHEAGGCQEEERGSRQKWYHYAYGCQSYRYDTGRYQ